MTAIVEGIYKDGKLDLMQIPAGLPEGHVRVILIAPGTQQQPPRYLPFGEYRMGRMSTLEDFKAAEWHGEAEFRPQPQFPDRKIMEP